LVTEGIKVSCGGGTGSERLNTVPLPELPPAHAVPYNVLPDKINSAITDRKLLFARRPVLDAARVSACLRFIFVSCVFPVTREKFPILKILSIEIDKFGHGCLEPQLVVCPVQGFKIPCEFLRLLMKPGLIGKFGIHRYRLGARAKSRRSSKLTITLFPVFANQFCLHLAIQPSLTINLHDFPQLQRNGSFRCVACPLPARIIQACLGAQLQPHQQLFVSFIDVSIATEQARPDGSFGEINSKCSRNPVPWQSPSNWET
jgi:hypothetical protein